MDGALAVLDHGLPSSWIVGHPNGERAQWVRNVEAAGSADVIDRFGAKTPVRATLLRGPDRDAAIDEHTRQQIAGPRLLYRLARLYPRSRRRLPA